MASVFTSLDELLRESPGKAPACPMCGAAMRLSAVTTTTTALRVSFRCPNCDHPESFSALQLRQLCGIREEDGAWSVD